jgi:hypothetical protein
VWLVTQSKTLYPSNVERKAECRTKQRDDKQRRKEIGQYASLKKGRPPPPMTTSVRRNDVADIECTKREPEREREREEENKNKRKTEREER